LGQNPKSKLAPASSPRQNGCFRVELDMHLYFVPPMDEHGAGIIVTRIVDLPFPPFNGLAIHGKTMSECPDPLGFRLEDVTWDVDRSVFLARTSLISQKFPFSYIADEIAAWIGRGWRLDSYADPYQQQDDDDLEVQNDGDETEAIDAGDDFEDEDSENCVLPVSVCELS
jgi:hypothetical protein